MKRLVCLLLVVINLSSLAQTDSSYPRFSVLSVQRDLDTAYHYLQQNHPDLYAHWSKEEADRSFKQLRANVTQPMTRAEFTRLFSPFVARFMDGHTYVEVDFEGTDFQHYVRSGGRFFPLKVVIISGKLYCLEDPFNTSPISKGDEITRINGVLAKEIISFMSSLWSADGDESRIATLQRLFSYSLYTAYGWGTLMEVEYKGAGGVKKIALKGIDKEQFLKLTFNQGGSNRNLFIHPDHSLAVVEIRQYNQTEKAKLFIDSCFRVIKELGIQNVALDLRNNGGGNSFIGDYFLSYLGSNPYQTISEKRWRVGPALRSLPADHWISQSLASNRKEYKENGEYLQSARFGPRQPVDIKEKNNRVAVNFFLLTSRRTFSSAHMTAMAVRCGEIGTIIGQPTGERLDLTGEILEFTLPATGIKLVVPSADYKAACGDGRQVGVLPHHLITTTIEDIKNDRDPELEMVKRLIKSR